MRSSPQNEGKSKQEKVDQKLVQNHTTLLDEQHLAPSPMLHSKAGRLQHQKQLENHVRREGSAVRPPEQGKESSHRLEAARS